MSRSFGSQGEGLRKGELWSGTKVPAKPPMRSGGGCVGVNAEVSGRTVGKWAAKTSLQNGHFWPSICRHLVLSSNLSVPRDNYIRYNKLTIAAL